MRRFPVYLVVGLALLLTNLTSTAAADILIATSTTAPTLTSDLVAVSFQEGANAPTVMGTLPGGSTFSFTTPGSLDSLYAHTNGHMRLEAEDGSINVLAITGSTIFSGLFADIFGVYDQDRDHVTVVVNTSGGIYTNVLPMTIGATSSNYLSIIATAGEQINSISLGTDASPARFIALRDIYVSDAQVPEPSSIMLMGTALASISAALRRRRK